MTYDADRLSEVLRPLTARLGVEVAHVESSTPSARVAQHSAPALPTPARGPSLSRAEKIAVLAAGSPFPLPEQMVAEAIASGMAVGAFALSVSNHAISVRAAERAEAEVDAIALRIVVA